MKLELPKKRRSGWWKT